MSWWESLHWCELFKEQGYTTRIETLPDTYLNTRYYIVATDRKGHTTTVKCTTGANDLYKREGMEHG